MQDDLTLAVDKTDLPQLVFELYPDSKARSGTTATVFAVWRGNHNSPSFSLYQQNGVWFYSDKVTGESGNAFDFLTKIHGMDPAEAGRYLKDRAGIMPSPGEERRARPRKRYERPAQAPQQAREARGTPLGEEEAEAFYRRASEGPHRPRALAARGLLLEDLEELSIIGAEDQPNDALIPMFSPDGELITIKRRIYQPTGNMKYKYEFKGHGSVPWISPHLANPDTRKVLVVEGELNGIVAWSVAHRLGLGFEVMGVPGADGRLYLDVLRGKQVYVYADGDEPGEAARMRWAREALDAGAEAAWLLEGSPPDEDFCALAGASGRTAFARYLKDLMRNAERAFDDDSQRSVGAYTVGALVDSGHRFASGEILLRTGFPDLDAYTGGMPDDDITLVGALPGLGKSAFLRQVMLKYLDDHPNGKTLLFTPDQSPKAVLRLIATMHSCVPLSVVRGGHPPLWLQEKHTTESARQAWLEAYDNAVVHLTKRMLLSERQTYEEVKQRIFQGVEEGVEMVLFDYLQMFEFEDKQGRPVEGKAIRDLKQHATGVWKVPLVMAAQLAKYKFTPQRRSGVPIPSDIEGKGVFYQQANHVYLLHNQDIYMRQLGLEEQDYMGYNPYDVGKARVVVAKNKEGEAGKQFVLNWNGPLVRFEPMGYSIPGAKQTAS